MYLISETWLHLPPSLSSPIFNQCHVNISPFLCFPPSPALRADDRKPWNPPVAPNSAPYEPLSSACTNSHQVRAFGLMNDHQWRNRHRLAYVRAALQPNEGHVMPVQPISHPSLTAQRVMGRPADPFQYLLMSNGTQAGQNRRESWTFISCLDAVSLSPMCLFLSQKRQHREVVNAILIIIDGAVLFFHPFVLSSSTSSSKHN